MSSACHTASESNTVIHNIINVYIYRWTNRSLCLLGSQYYWLSVWGFFPQIFPKTDTKTKGLSWSRCLIPWKYIGFQHKQHLIACHLSAWRLHAGEKILKNSRWKSFLTCTTFKRWHLCWVSLCVIFCYGKDDPETHFLTSICSSTVIRPSPLHALWQPQKLLNQIDCYSRGVCVCVMQKTRFASIKATSSERFFIFMVTLTQLRALCSP